ncbi:MAG TPA: hypothetical protein VIH50_07935 [Steroidobacteraceae bacterium]|jgi:hypothetical protein
MAARTKPQRLQHFLMSGEEAQKPQNIIKMFEAIKGRKATAREIAQFERKSPAVKDREPQ